MKQVEKKVSETEDKVKKLDQRQRKILKKQIEHLGHYQKIKPMNHGVEKGKEVKTYLKNSRRLPQSRERMGGFHNMKPSRSKEASLNIL
jgi:mRNA-degrading endonuclease RelE of RelBE toxin-antitoxin system